MPSRFLLLLLPVLACLVACSTSPTPQRYVLESLAEKTHQGSGNARQQSLSVGLSTVTLPAYLDRLPIVHRQGQALTMNDYQRWAEPLAESVPRVLADNLSVLLPGVRVVRSPWSQQGHPDWKIVLYIDRLEAEGNKTVAVHASWTVLDHEGKVLSEKTTNFSEPVTSSLLAGDTAAIVAAHNQALEALSRTIADDIKTLALKAQ